MAVTWLSSTQSSVHKDKVNKERRKVGEKSVPGLPPPSLHHPPLLHASHSCFPVELAALINSRERDQNQDQDRDQNQDRDQDS